MFKNMLRKRLIASLQTQLMLPIRSYLKITLCLSEVERELLRNPGLRKTYDRVSIELPESPHEKLPAINLDDIEKEFHRDEKFAALVAEARQDYSSELSALRRKLHNNRLLLETFIRTVGTPDNCVDIQDVLTALKHLASLSKPTVPPSPVLMQEAEALAALLR